MVRRAARELGGRDASCRDEDLSFRLQWRAEGSWSICVNDNRFDPAGDDDLTPTESKSHEEDSTAGDYGLSEEGVRRRNPVDVCGGGSGFRRQFGFGAILPIAAFDPGRGSSRQLGGRQASPVVDQRRLDGDLLFLGRSGAETGADRGP
ncbi:hypothetical protein AC249_AIPGENE29164, partial [Exaiptasia diaphana]